MDGVPFFQFFINCLMNLMKNKFKGGEKYEDPGWNCKLDVKFAVSPWILILLSPFKPIFSGDCLMSEWTSWTGCTATCATGTERRIRRQLVVPWSFQNKMTCDGTTFACKTGSLICNIEMGPRCSDGSKILDRIESGFECDREHIEILPCNIPECPHPPEGKHFNAHICLYNVL